MKMCDEKEKYFREMYFPQKYVPCVMWNGEMTATLVNKQLSWIT
jgi:hypothetical protein